MEKKILIVSSAYYPEIAENLKKGATSYLNLIKSNYDIKYCSGSFEIPFTINQYLNSYLGFIALGCIIRGETYHFELIANEVTRKIMDLSIDSKKPIGFGILTCENEEQAVFRSDPLKGNKGEEAARACTESLALYYRGQ